MRSTPPGFPAWYPGWFLHVERWFWRTWHSIQDPRRWWSDWLHWHQRPRPGDKILHHDDLVTVIRVKGDNIVLEGGQLCSWMHCCSWAGSPGRFFGLRRNRRSS